MTVGDYATAAAACRIVRRVQPLLIVSRELLAGRPPSAHQADVEPCSHWGTPTGEAGAYRVAVGSRSVVALALAVVAVAATTTGAAATSPPLRLDGLRFRPELALTPTQRSIGLMHREAAPADGMLFVFPKDTRRGFWMEGTLVPLRIVFFDARGKRVRTLLLAPCREDPCPIFSPGKRYRFALELPAEDMRPARALGPPAALRSLSRVAR
jgi:uncharacterized membrane protein (UPF0127 family)